MVMAMTNATGYTFVQRARAAQDLLYDRTCRLRENRVKTVRSNDVISHLARKTRMCRDLSVPYDDDSPEPCGGGSDASPTRRSTSPSGTAPSTFATVHRIDVMSYAIECTWNLLRHVYISFDTGTCKQIEIHAGMSNLGSDDSETDRRSVTETNNGERATTVTDVQHRQQLMYSTPNYYGNGRSEGYMLLCDNCATAELDDAQRKNSLFFLPFNNCDTIVPFVLQTPLLWFSVFGLLVGALISTQTFNVFVLTLFVPVIAFLITVLYNRNVDDERRHCVLRRCVHVNHIVAKNLTDCYAIPWNEERHLAVIR